VRRRPRRFHKRDQSHLSPVDLSSPLGGVLPHSLLFSPSPGKVRTVCSKRRLERFANETSLPTTPSSSNPSLRPTTNFSSSPPSRPSHPFHAYLTFTPALRPFGTSAHSFHAALASDANSNASTQPCTLLLLLLSRSTSSASPLLLLLYYAYVLSTGIAAQPAAANILHR
jgi:hypothetical protein